MSKHGNSVDLTLDIAQGADLPDFKKALQRAFMLSVAEEMGSMGEKIPADEDIEALRLQSADGVVDRGWAGRGSDSGCGQSEGGGCQRARDDGGEEDLPHDGTFLVFCDN